MSVRNDELGGAPALCTHDELMHAVWADEPTHTREELAKLVWELRKKLEPFDAGHLIENERGLGYRIRTCGGDADRGETPPAEPLRSRRRQLLIALLATAAAAGAAGGIVLATRPSHGSATPPASVTAFVDRLENVLRQSREGRREIAAALEAGLACSIPRSLAAQRISERRRESAEHPRAAREPPGPDGRDERAREAAPGRAAAVDRSRPPLPRRLRDCRAAGALDLRATAAKQRFVAAFDPLARRAHRAAWSAGDF